MSQPSAEVKNVDDHQIETLARHAHARYAESARGARAAVPWERLSEVDRASNRDWARFQPDLAAALGLEVVDLGNSDIRTALTDEEVDAGGRLEHLRWSRFTRAAGRTDHPDLVPWDQIDDATRELDYMRVRDLPSILRAVGLALADSHHSASAESGQHAATRAHRPDLR